MIPRVLIVTLTTDKVMPECLSALKKQNYENFNILVDAMPPIFSGEEYAKTKNSALHRNAVKKVALTYPADCFLMVDSDTVLSPGALRSLVGRDLPIVGGWYNMVTNRARWAAALRVDGGYANFEYPAPGLCEVDMIGLGCILLSRRAYQDIEFSAGLDTMTTLADGRTCPIGISAQFGLDAQAKGYKLYMDGNVICDHLSRPAGFS